MPGRNRFIRRVALNSPVVECTPLVWKGRLLLQEVWQSHWDGKAPIEEREYRVQFREAETGDVEAACLDGFAFASSFVWEDAVHVFASRLLEEGGRQTANHVWMSRSTDLRAWSEPALAVEQEAGEHLYNQSVCWDGKRFVMAYESNAFAPFTIKFAVSEDLRAWRKVDGAIFGAERYTACPAIRFCGGAYYMLYLEMFDAPRRFCTCVARSYDLAVWRVSVFNPVLAPDPTRDVHPDCPDDVKECNASDPDLVEWEGRTRLYFTGGHQHWGGDLQYVECEGPMRDFFESYFDD